MTVSSEVQVGDPADTGPTFTLTITRDPADAITDWTTANSVLLVLPDGTTHPVTKSSATASTWIGTIRYNAWWTTRSAYTTRTRATFVDGAVMTCVGNLIFEVG